MPLNRIAALAFVAAAFVAVGGRASAATLTIVNGEVVGAEGVVYGASYNVEFVEGTCTAVFTGCNTNTDFAFGFGGADDSHYAYSQALPEVFTGVYDLEPALTCGCESITQCYIYSPFELQGLSEINVGFALNQTLLDDASSSPGDYATLSQSYDTSTDATAVYAQWSLATAVPDVSSSGSLLLMGLGAMGLISRRVRR